MTPSSSEGLWLSAYGSLPATLSPNHGTVLSYFKDVASTRPDREALRYFDASLSYGEVERLSAGFAAWLRDAGIKPGDRVAIVLQNVPHFVVATLAIWMAGAIPVPGNPMYKARELGRIFADCTPSAVLCHSELLAETRQGLAEAGIPDRPTVVIQARDFQTRNDERILPPRQDTSGAEDFIALCRRHEEAARYPIEEQPDGIGLILYTSGTTGLPKGAVIRHRSLAFNATVALEWMGLDQGSRLLALAPLFHITGFTLHICFAMAAGCSLGLQYRFHPEAVLDVIRNYRPTWTIAAITAFNAFMKTGQARKDDFASFDRVFSGGAPIAPALRQQVFDELGLSLSPVYGLTETAGQTHLCPRGAQVPVHPVAGALSAGVPISSTEATIVNPDGKPVAPGEQGEVWIRGPQVMTGYWNNPEETQRCMEGGWFKTGDIGIMDEKGWFYIVDRQKDMINSSGFKVWPREVEDVLLSHPSVHEAAVVGAPDAYRGETVVAYVAIRNNRGLIEEDEIIAYCRSCLAAYKAPRKIHVLPELPKTTTGKIQRNILRERAAALD